MWFCLQSQGWGSPWARFTAWSQSLTPEHSQVFRCLGSWLWVLNRGAGWDVCPGVGREGSLDPWDIAQWFFREGYRWDSSRETPACLGENGYGLSRQGKWPQTILPSKWTQQGTEQEGEGGLAQRVPSVLGRQWGLYACLWVRGLDLCVKDTHFTQLLRHHGRC